jgi:leucyl-tRNA synthetase
MLRRYVDAGSPAGNPTEETLKRAHKTIQLVTDHVERLRFNTALAAMMDQLNYLAKLKPEEIGRFAVESFILLLAPMAPHVTEEIWRALGHNTSVHLEPWPKFDPKLARDEMVTIIVQINGKVRDRLEVAAGTSEDVIRQQALKSESVIRHLAGKTPTKFIFVKDKMLSIVA